MLRTKYQHIGLQTILQQSLNRVLSRLGLQLGTCRHIGYKCQMNQRRIAITELIAQLTYRLNVRQRLDIAHRTTDLGNDHIVALLSRQQLNATLDLVGNMGDNLNGLAHILATTLLVDYTLVDLTRRNRIRTRRRDRRKTLIVAQIEVSLRSVVGNIALAVLVRIQRTWIDVDIRVALLDCNRIAACLQQTRNRR